MGFKCGDRFNIELIGNKIFFKVLSGFINEESRTSVLDEFGRILIPKNIRTSINVKANDKMNIYIEDNAIVLSKENS